MVQEITVIAGLVTRTRKTDLRTTSKTASAGQSLKMMTTSATTITRDHEIATAKIQMLIAWNAVLRGPHRHAKTDPSVTSNEQWFRWKINANNQHGLLRPRKFWMESRFMLIYFSTNNDADDIGSESDVGDWNVHCSKSTVSKEASFQQHSFWIRSRIGILSCVLAACRLRSLWVR